MSGVEVVETYIERYPRARLLAALTLAQARSTRKDRVSTLGEVWAAYRRLYGVGGPSGSVGWFRTMARDGLVENPRRSLWRITRAGYARAFLEITTKHEIALEAPLAHAVEDHREAFDRLYRSIIESLPEDAL